MKLPLPSPSYLELHACCRVANLSGADKYVDNFERNGGYLLGAVAGWHFYFDMRSRPGVRKVQSTFSSLWVIRFPFHPYNLLHCNLHEIQTFSLLTDVVRPFWPWSGPRSITLSSCTTLRIEFKSGKPLLSFKYHNWFFLAATWDLWLKCTLLLTLGPHSRTNLLLLFMIQFMVGKLARSRDQSCCGAALDAQDTIEKGYRLTGTEV